MEDAILTVLAIVGIAIGLAALVVPFIALGLAVSAGRRLAQTERRLASAEHELSVLRYELGRQSAQLARGLAPWPTAPVAPTPAPAASPAPSPSEVVLAPPVTPAPTRDAPVTAGEPAPVVTGEALAAKELLPPEPAPAPAPIAAAAPVAPPAISPPVASPVFSAAPAPAPRSAPPSRPDSPASLEEQLGLTWLTRIGAAAFVLGALFFFKYAVDSAWIGPAGRVAVGGLVGAALLVAAEVTAARSKASFVQSLTGVGLAVLFAATWASSALYGLVSVTTAFVVSAVWLLLGAGLAYRRRGEAILVLTLVAALLNPVVLSTGQDRPLALFGYLLLITTVVLAVATELGFRFVPWLAVLGTTALFGGWYDRHFDISDRRGNPYLDVAPESLVGAYLELHTRVVPLLAALAFGGQWTLAALRGQQKDAPRAAVLGLALAGLSLAHAASVMLLHDSPLALGLLAVVLAVASMAALRALAAGLALAVPMGAAFLALLIVAADMPDDSRVPFLALLGLWTLVYVAGFLRAGGAGVIGSLVSRELPPNNALFATLALGAFALLGVVVLGEDHGSAAAALVSVATAGAAAVAWLSRRPGLWLGALVTSLVLVLVCGAFVTDASEGPFAPDFLGAATLWGLVTLGATGVVARAEEESGRVGATLVAAASLAVAGFLTAALLVTDSRVPTLRALLTGGAGLGAVAAGLWFERSPLRRSTQAPILLGQALGLFAAALAFGLEGAPVTVLWAALGAVAAAIAARSGERVWLGTSALLFLAAVLRLLAVDVGEAHRLTQTWLDSHGREGLFALPAFFNPRAYASFGTGAALLVAAWVLRRGDAQARFGAALAAVGGYGLWLSVAVTETRAAFTDVPPLPTMALDDAEWWAFREGFDRAMNAQAGSLSMGTTLVLGLSAIVLLAAGFAARSALHRGIGLTLFLATVAKLATWDIFNLERLYQIVTLTGVGALLIGGGFLYARFGKRLVALIREDDADKAPRPAAGPVPPLVVLMLLLLSRGAAAEPAAEPLDVGPFATVRELSGISAPGDYVFEADADLYRASQGPRLLGDLRIVGPGGAAVPYVLSEVAVPSPPPAQSTLVLDPGELADGSVRATFEVPRRVARHGCLELGVRGDGFLRRVRVETGSSPEPDLVVAEGAFVYRVSQPERVAEHLRVRYPLSAARYVRVTLLASPASAPDDGGSLRLERAEVGCFEGSPPPEPASFDVPLRIESTSRDPGRKVTLFLLDAGAEGVPKDELVLDVATPELERRVEVGASSFRGVFPAVGGGMIYRARPRDGLVLSSLSVPLSGTRKRWLEVTIHDGDSAPLEVSGFHAKAPRREIRLRASAAGPHEVYLGAPDEYPPSYDLAAVLARGDRSVTPLPVSLGPSRPNPRQGQAPREAELPWTERNRGAVGAALGVVLVALCVWLGLRLRREGKVAPPS